MGGRRRHLIETKKMKDLNLKQSARGKIRTCEPQVCTCANAGGFGKLLEPDLRATGWYLQNVSANAGGLEGTLPDPVNASVSHTSAPAKYRCQYKWPASPPKEKIFQEGKHVLEKLPSALLDSCARNL